MNSTPRDTKHGQLVMKGLSRKPVQEQSLHVLLTEHHSEPWDTSKAARVFLKHKIYSSFKMFMAKSMIKSDWIVKLCLEGKGKSIGVWKSRFTCVNRDLGFIRSQNCPAINHLTQNRCILFAPPWREVGD